MPSVEIRPPAFDPGPTISIEPQTAPPPMPPSSVFTGPPQGLTDPTVAVPPIVAPPDFQPEPPSPDEPTGAGEADGPALPLVDRTGRDSVGAALSIAGVVLWVGVVIGLWWFLTRTSEPLVGPVKLPTPQATWDRLSELVAANAFWDHALSSAIRLIAALVGGSALGLLLGWVIGALPRAGRLLRPATGVLRFFVPIMSIGFLGLWADASSVHWGWAPAALAVAGVVAHGTASASVDAAAGLSGNRAARTVGVVRMAVPTAWATVMIYELFGGVAEHGVAVSLLEDRVQLRTPDLIIWMAVAFALALVVDTVLRIGQHLLRPNRRIDVPPPLR